MTAEPQVSRQRQEPALHSVRVSAGVPDIGDRRAKLAAQFRHVRGGVTQLSAGWPAAGLRKFGHEIMHVDFS